jgi:hypothetical protein
MANAIPPFMPTAFASFTVRVGGGLFTLPAPDGANLDMTVENTGDAPAWIAFGASTIPVPGPNTAGGMLLTASSGPVLVPSTMGAATATTAAVFSPGNASINFVRGWTMLASRGNF